MKVLIAHGYLLRGTGSNIYNANLARALARLGHEVHLLCQERNWDAPEGVTVHNPDIGRVLPVYVADTYDGFDAKPYPDLTDAELDHYIEANVAAVRDAPTCDVALANHLVMNPVILARGLSDSTPFAIKLIVSKGVDLLLAAWPLVVARVPEARLVIVGFGTYRDALGRFVEAMRRRDLEDLRDIAARGRELEGGPRGKLKHLTSFLDRADGEWLEAAPAAPGRIHFTGRLEHDGPPALLPPLQA